ncbi:MAG: BMC domain-containing protein [Lachnospiraceae bacterium]|nr:BMC domain-containing protein [Lachnospiraceae bacterium]
MKYAIIDRPAAGTLQIIKRKAFDKRMQDMIDNSPRIESLGICQGSVLEVVVASDVAEKASDVLAGELNGTCPNHITCLVVMGSTAAVKSAMDSIRREMDAL